MSNVLKHKILVVDDDEGVRETLVMVLRSSGYDVNYAIHGFDALLQLRGDEFLHANLRFGASVAATASWLAR